MADTKISALTNGAPAQGTEELPVALSGSNYKLTTGDVALLALQDGHQGAITVEAATTAALAGSPVYANGAAGVGATLTKGSNGAFPSQDGVASVVGNVYLVKNQATQTQNGVYELTTLGTAGTPWVLTRTTDSDQPAELNAQIVIVGAGTVNKRRLYSQTTPTPTIGTNNIVYAQTPAPNMSEYVKRDGTVDFIAAETWDAGGTDTVTVSPSAITVTDGTDSSYMDKVNIVITDGADSVTLAKDSISVTDAADTAFMSNLSIAVNSIGSGANASINANGIILSNGVQQSNIRFIKKTLSSTEIISLLSTPIVLITSPGGGTFINLISCTARLVYNSAAFDNLAIYAITASATKDTYMLRTSDTFLNNVGGKVEKMFDMRVTNQSSLMYEAEDVMLISEADSVAAGDSSVELFAIYEIITF